MFEGLFVYINPNKNTRDYRFASNCSKKKDSLLYEEQVITIAGYVPNECIENNPVRVLIGMGIYMLEHIGGLHEHSNNYCSSSCNTWNNMDIYRYYSGT